MSPHDLFYLLHDLTSFWRRFSSDVDTQLLWDHSQKSCCPPLPRVCYLDSECRVFSLRAELHVPQWHPQLWLPPESAQGWFWRYAVNPLAVALPTRWVWKYRAKRRAVSAVMLLFPVTMRLIRPGSTSRASANLFWLNPNGSMYTSSRISPGWMGGFMMSDMMLSP